MQRDFVPDRVIAISYHHQLLQRTDVQDIHKTV